MSDQQGYTLSGFRIKFGRYHFRIWKSGFEYGNELGGRVFFFPWVKVG